MQGTARVQLQTIKNRTIRMRYTTVGEQGMTTPRTTHLLVRALDTNRDVTKVDLMLTAIVV
jgi:hypothetical protein